MQNHTPEQIHTSLFQFFEFPGTYFWIWGLRERTAAAELQQRLKFTSIWSLWALCSSLILFLTPHCLSCHPLLFLLSCLLRILLVQHLSPRVWASPLLQPHTGFLIQHFWFAIYWTWFFFSITAKANVVSAFMHGRVGLKTRRRGWEKDYSISH